MSVNATSIFKESDVAKTLSEQYAVVKADKAKRITSNVYY